ncbi:MAG: protein kinase [Kofleriaceae bacterium]|nr:protein kinase [Kofleriaceae bacterium]
MAHSLARVAIDVGMVIADTYTVEALVGRGGMGSVFLASHTRLAGKKVAIKVLHTEVAGDEALARFKREADIASKLGHPNIVAVHDFNTLPDGSPYVVLEYLEGEPLSERVGRGPLPVTEVFSITRQIASALAAAHRAGIVHRDLKPHNVFLCPTEIGGVHVEQVKVLDFGISKVRGSSTVQTQDSTLLGTPQYMAPEQATGQHALIDERTDLFALGSIVYELLCGKPAFIGDSVPEVVFKVVYEEPIPIEQRVVGLAPGIAAAVRKAMAKKPDERFRTVAEFVQALTGDALSTGRGPVPASVAAARDAPSQRGAAGDALARTVDSGNHGPIPLGVAATMASGDHSGSAERARQQLAASAAGATPPTAPIASAPTAPTPDGARPGRRTGLLVAVGLLLAGGAVAALVLTRGAAGPAATTPGAAAAVADAALVVTSPGIDAANPIGADAGAADPTAVDAAVKPAGVDARPGPRPRPDAAPAAGDGDGDGDGGGDGDAGGRALRLEAEAALRAGNTDRADKLAKRMIDAGKPGLRRAGYLLQGKIACSRKQFEVALTASNALRGTPAHRQLATYCSGKGIEL